MSFRTHELKCWPPFFWDIKTGAKPFELRRNDRDFRAGDLLILREWNDVARAYTGDRVERIVSYVLTDFAGLEPGFAVIGLRVP